MKLSVLFSSPSTIDASRTLCGLMSGLFLLLGVPGAQASPVSFYTIDSISSNTFETDVLAASGLIEGSGVGFDANTYDQLGTSLKWATVRNCYPCDYFTSGLPVPVLTLDLGQNRRLSEISVWGYGQPNAVSAFSLRFATSNEGVGSFGTSIAYNPNFSPAMQSQTMQEFGFAQEVMARYVEFRATDNFYSSSAAQDGGDRVGLSEIAFESSVPEPGSLALVGAAFLAVVACRRRARQS
ncbi:PEP-CTERM sorting domain-containing protein [Roseateles sp. GG27B]